MGSALYGCNAVCMAMLAVSAEMWDGTARAASVDRAVMIIQLVSLAGRWVVVDQASEFRVPWCASMLNRSRRIIGHT